MTVLECVVVLYRLKSDILSLYTIEKHNKLITAAYGGPPTVVLASLYSTNVQTYLIDLLKSQPAVLVLLYYMLRVRPSLDFSYDAPYSSEFRHCTFKIKTKNILEAYTAVPL